MTNVLFNSQDLDSGTISVISLQAIHPWHTQSTLGEEKNPFCECLNKNWEEMLNVLRFCILKNKLQQQEFIIMSNPERADICVALLWDWTWGHAFPLKELVCVCCHGRLKWYSYHGMLSSNCTFSPTVHSTENSELLPFTGTSDT